MTDYNVFVAGVPKGVVYKKNNRWLWYVKPRGIEGFRRLAEVAPFIARATLNTIGAVKLVKVPRGAEGRY